jgi:hypothetical protein
MTLDPQWAELEKERHPGPGTIRRRVLPGSGHDLFLQLRLPEGFRSVALSLHGRPGESWRQMRSSRGLRVQAGVESDDISYVRVEEADARYREIFGALVDDILRHLSEARPEDSPQEVVCGRIRRWQACMEATGDGSLPEDRQEGLFAELLVLVDTFMVVRGALEGVRAWTGPSRAVQDFQWDRHALEVKSSRAAEPQQMEISGERQLDSTGHDRLVLTHIALDRRTAGTGETLPEMVARVRQATAGEPAAIEILEDKLLKAGYLAIHEDRYAGLRYSLRKQEYFEVLAGFPRITEGDLPGGVGQVTYRVTISACRPFAMREEDVRSLVASGGDA